MTNIAIFGATGRMGRTLIRMIAASENLRLTGAGAAPGETAIGTDAGLNAGVEELGVAIASEPAATLGGADVAIDFTLPAAFDANLAACRGARVALVLGTTGLNDTQMSAMNDAAGDIPIVYGRNMSVGVNLLTSLVRIAGKTLGDDYDVEITEAHHRRKIDAPSGTALQLGETVAAARGSSLDRAGVFDRHGTTGPRVPGSIGFSVIRAGAIVGDHTVLFGADEEIIELRHRAQDRGAFGQGALRAARWLASQSPGLYGMADVLGLQ